MITKSKAIFLLGLFPFAIVQAQIKPSPYIYHVTLPKYSSRAIIDAYLNGLAHADTFVVTVTKGKILKILVKEKNSAGNIRINQIIAPDGSMDGPFSKKVSYPIKLKGTYKIIVGGSKMQGNNWKGYFTFSIATS